MEDGNVKKDERKHLMNNNKSRKCATQIEQYDNKTKNRRNKRMKCERNMKLG